MESTTKLTINERVRLFEILPAQGGIGDVRTIMRLREMLEFTEAEKEDHKIVVTSFRNPMTGTMMSSANWSPESVAFEAELELSNAGLLLLNKLLADLVKKEQLPVELLSAYDKIVPKEES